MEVVAVDIPAADAVADDDEERWGLAEIDVLLGPYM